MFCIKQPKGISDPNAQPRRQALPKTKVCMPIYATALEILTLSQKCLSFDHLWRKLDQKYCLARPHFALGDRVSCYFRWKICAVAHAFDNARCERRAVQLAHLSWHGDVLVYERLVVDNHVLLRRVQTVAFLEAVSLPSKQVCPSVLLDKVKQGNDIQRS